jgi:hypothetical protein
MVSAASLAALAGALAGASFSAAATLCAAANPAAFATPSAAAPERPAAAGTLTADAGARFAALALKCLHQEYPNHISHTLNGAADARPPHELTPAFYGCLDWHSDVHGHWLLVRLLRLFPDASFAADARAELSRSLTPQNIAGEVAYLRAQGRASFERPYGLAWLLRLARAAPLRGCGRSALGEHPRAARKRSSGAPRQLVTEAPLSDSHRRARSDRLRLWPHVGLGRGARGYADAGAAQRCGRALLPA